MKTRKILLGVLLAGAAAGLFSGCSSMAQGPTYTDAEPGPPASAGAAGGAAT
jgi:hypothetical protein